MAVTKAKKGKKAKKPASAKKASQGTSFIYNRQAQLILIFLVGILLYSNTLFHDFTQDDAIVIYDNEFTTKGVAGIPDILSKDTFHGFFGEKKNLVEGGRYRPLSLVVFAMEWTIFGRSPMVGHFGNILLYGLTCMVVYLFLSMLLNPKRKQEIAPWAIVLGATLLFTVHPIHTEAVANIKGRDEIMALIFSLLAAYFVLKSHHLKDYKYAVLGGAMIFLGHMSKENAVTFLGIIPVALYLFTNAKISEILQKIAPLFVGAAAFWIIRAIVLAPDPNIVIVSNGVADLMNQPFVDMTASQKYATITYTLGKYIQLLVAPLILTHDYYPYHIPKMNWSDWQVILALVLNLGLAAYATFVFFFKRGKISETSNKLPASKIAGFGIMFYFMSMSVIANIVIVIGTFMSERFMFMPSVGFALIAALLLFRLGEKLNSGKEITSLQELKIPIVVLAIICGLYAIKTVSRNMVWKDNYTLFTTDIKTSLNSAKLRNAAGGEIVSRAVEVKNAGLKELANITDSGQRKARLAQLDAAFEPPIKEAIGHLKVAAQIHPTYSNAYLQLGNTHNYLKQYRTAFEYFKKSLDYKENSKDALNNLGVTYRDAANYIGEENKREQYSQAMGYFQESIKYFDRLKPFTKEQEQLVKNKAQTYRDWGKFYGERIQDFDTALRYLNMAKDLNPNDNETYRFIGLCYASKGQMGEAITLFEDLLKKQPENANIMFNLGNFYRQSGQEEKGNQLVQKALQLDSSLGRK